jgi:hypothetical protein
VAPLAKEGTNWPPVPASTFSHEPLIGAIAIGSEYRYELLSSYFVIQTGSFYPEPAHPDMLICLKGVLSLLRKLIHCSVTTFTRHAAIS